MLFDYVMWDGDNDDEVEETTYSSGLEDWAEELDDLLYGDQE